MYMLFLKSKNIDRSKKFIFQIYILKKYKLVLKLKNINKYYYKTIKLIN